MSAIILLADPAETRLKETSNFLKSHFFEVIVARNGREAQLSLYSNKISAIVLNLALQDHAGIQVFKYIKQNNPSLKVILTVEDEMSLAMVRLNKNTLEKQKTVEVLIQPFELNRLLECLKGYQHNSMANIQGPVREGQSQEVMVQVDDEKFTSIKIGEFFSSKAVQFDIYVRLNKDKYVKILQEGDSFSQERIEKYKQKSVELLYFLNDDRQKYVNFGNFLSEKMATKSNISTTTKIKLLKNLGEKFVEEMYTVGLKPQILDQGKNYCHNMYETINKNEDLYRLIRDYNDFDPSAYSHTYLVCLFTGMISKQFYWEEATSADILGMAALFHDIGLMKLPQHILAVRPEKMNAQDLKLYKTHPILGVEILARNSKISEVVKQIILQHHECADGTGFPSGLRSNKILIFSRILSMCDEFTHYMVEKKLAPPAAFKLFVREPNCLKKYSMALLENFIKIFADSMKVPDSNS